MHDPIGALKRKKKVILVTELSIFRKKTFNIYCSGQRHQCLIMGLHTKFSTFSRK